MRPYRRFSTLPQLTLSLATFVVLILVLESGGLYEWAQRLDLGPERTIALPIFTLLHRALAPLRIEKQRNHALITLARIGWSDDPALLATFKPPPPSASITALKLGAPDLSHLEIGVLTATPVAKEPAPLIPHPRPILLNLAEPPTFTKLPSIPAIEPGQTRTIAMAGDSMMAVGLSSAIMREAPRYPDLTFLSLFKSGTGLARPEVFNWQLEYPAMLRQSRPDFIIVAIGANDGQGFVEDGTVYPFASPGWQRIYQRRVEAYLDMLQSHGATVIWLGLPPMKDETLDTRMDAINRIDYDVVTSTPHAIWFSTAGVIGDTAGHFRDFGEVHGRTEKLRQGDGIHLSDEGAALIVTKLLPWLSAQCSLQTENPCAAH
jgi:lysophospholipase L1-like esterase